MTSNQPAHGRASFFSIFLCSIIAVLYLIYLAHDMVRLVSMHDDPHSPILIASKELPQADYARFWYEGKSLFISRAEVLRQEFPNSSWLRSELKVTAPASIPHPEAGWLYPPTMGPLAVLFSFIPLALSFWVWRAATLLIAAICLRYAGLGWLVIIAGLLCPAGITDVLTGQNGALTAGLFISALLCFDTKPRFGGGLAGLLCIKPQVAIALPFILFRSRYRRALLACLLVAAAMILLSIIVGGWTSWISFITISGSISSRVMNAPINKLAPGGITVLMMARTFHATVSEAWALQAVSSATAGMIVWHIWRAPTSDQIGRTALTVCLSLLITPYGFLYDLVGFAIAMAAMFARTSNRQKPIFALLWLLSGYVGVIASLTTLDLMPIAAAAGAWLIWDQGKTRKAGQPGPAGAAGPQTPITLR